MLKDKVTVADAVRELRSHLLEATNEGVDQAIRFMPKSVEVELGITFSLEAEASGGFKLWSLIDLSGKGKIGDESTHKVKLVLEPVGRDGKPTLIGSTVLERK
jgi:hypothetical protein